MAELDEDIKHKIELEVRRITTEIDSRREIAVIETLKSQRDFLVGNTRWVVGGFFGLLVVFGALTTFIFGTQLDTKIIDQWINTTLSSTLAQKVDLFVEKSVREKTPEVRDSIAQAAAEVQQRAITDIGASLDENINDILTTGVSTKIEEATKEFRNLSADDILARVIPSGAVLAFDRSTGCPPGWSDFADAAGRSIVGVGEGRGLTKRTYREQFGDESHIHVVRGTEVRGTSLGNDDLGLIAYGAPFPPPVTGNTAALPPSIALYLCKKL